jgi:hypothetical protein
MSFTYGKIESQVSSLLGLIVGADLATVGTNYSATASTSNRQNPDFAIPAIQDAIIDAVTEIVRTIAETPRHPERVDFRDISGALSNRATLPQNGQGGTLFIGVFGRVYDSSNNKSLLPAPLDDVRNFNEFSATVYSGFTPYWYAWNGAAIEHTRTTVLIEGCVWARPTYTTGNQVPLRDYHEWPLVHGAIVHLAGREGAYQALWNDSKAIWDEHLAMIRAIGNAELTTDAQGAPSTT